MYCSNKNYLGLQSLFIEDNSIFFPSYVGNGFFCMQDKKLELLSQFEWEQMDYEIKLYGEVKKYKDSLILIPEVANQIAIYDLINRDIKKMELKVFCPQVPSKFQLGIIHNDSLIMFPTYFPGILVKNLKNGDEILIDDWLDDIEAYSVRGKDAILGFNYVIRGSKVYIPSCRSHAVLEFNIENNKAKVRNVGNIGYSSICDDGIYMWLMPRGDGEITKWNPETDEIQKNSNYPKDYIPGGTVGCIYQNDFIYSFPEVGNMVLRINVETGEINEVKELTDLCYAPYEEKSVDNVAFTIACKYKGNIIAYAGRATALIEYDPKNNTVKKVQLGVPNSMNRYYDELRIDKERKYFAQEIISEVGSHRLNNFIKYICGEL